MEIEVKKKPAEFQPVEVVIRITTEVELEGLKCMCLYNTSIPDLITTCSSAKSADAVKTFLTRLGNLL